jgi:hypothetical protein
MIFAIQLGQDVAVFKPCPNLALNVRLLVSLLKPNFQLLLSCSLLHLNHVQDCC